VFSMSTYLLHACIFLSTIEASDRKDGCGKVVSHVRIQRQRQAFLAAVISQLASQMDPGIGTRTNAWQGGEEIGIIAPTG